MKINMKKKTTVTIGRGSKKSAYMQIEISKDFIAKTMCPQSHKVSYSLDLGNHVTPYPSHLHSIRT